MSKKITKRTQRQEILEKVRAITVSRSESYYYPNMNNFTLYEIDKKIIIEQNIELYSAIKIAQDYSKTKSCYPVILDHVYRYYNMKKSYTLLKTILVFNTGDLISVGKNGFFINKRDPETLSKVTAY